MLCLHIPVECVAYFLISLDDVSSLSVPTIVGRVVSSSRQPSGVVIPHWMSTGNEAKWRRTLGGKIYSVVQT